MSASLTIRLATTTDLAAIMPLFDSARRFMRSRGNRVQWVGGYPSEALIRADIERGNCYVGLAADGHIECVFAFILGADPTYAHIEGAWLDDQSYGTIHRLASSGRVQGVVAQCVAFCFTLVDNIRLDTHACNAPMRRAAERLGFRECGTIYVADGTPRIAYQLRRTDFGAKERE